MKGNYRYSQWSDELPSYLSLLAMLILIPEANAVDNFDKEWGNVALYIKGALTESPCNLELASAYQDITLSYIGYLSIAEPGDSVEAILFELHFSRCLKRTALSTDQTTGLVTFSCKTPSLTVTFNTQHYLGNYQLFKVNGASGATMLLYENNGWSVIFLTLKEIKFNMIQLVT